jgi:large subunit ribosomal protein L9
MAKELILFDDVIGLGIVGDIVRVADGYARNFLLPKKLAGPVSDETRQKLATRRAVREQELKEELAAAEKFATKVEAAHCKVMVRTSAEGRLYGSVKVADVIKAATEARLDLTKDQIMIDQPMRELGDFEVGVRLHRDVTAKLKVSIVEEEEE